MRYVLVIGGAGFVGSHLCERLHADGYTVTSLDNYSTGSANNHIDGVKYIRGEAKDVETILSGADFDVVYHLGEYSRVEQSYDDIDKVLDYNICSLGPVVRYVKKTGAKLVYSGSSTKFSAEGGSLSPYAWSKVVNVDFIKNYAEWYGLDYAITYFYNVYGDREISTGKYSTVVGKFLNMKLHGFYGSANVTSPGTQERNFTHVDDIVDGLILVGLKGQGDGYGIGSPESYSIIQLAELMKLKYVLTDAVKGNRMSAPVMSDKTIGLGWSAKHNLKTYIVQKLKDVL